MNKAMGISNEKDKNCESCGYYLRHYANLYGSFYPVNGGHCYCGQMKLTESAKIIKKRGKCQFWIPREEQAKKRQENMEKVIRDIAKNLDEYVRILKLENGNNIQPKK